MIKLGNLLEQQLAELAQSISLDDIAAHQKRQIGSLITDDLLGHTEQMREEQSPHGPAGRVLGRSYGQLA